MKGTADSEAHHNAQAIAAAVNASHEPRLRATWLGLLVSVGVLLLYALVLRTAGPASAQDAPAPKPEEEVAALELALVRAVSTPDGHHVAHCRRAPTGCIERMRALARLFVEYGRAYEVDPWLLAAIASRESGLNPWVSGSIGEIGLMQIHPRSRGGRRVLALLERPGERARCARRVDACQRPVVDAGAALLAAALERERGDVLRALALYNAGRPESEAGQRYARRVLRRRDQLSAWAREEAVAVERDDQGNYVRLGIHLEAAP